MKPTNLKEFVAKSILVRMYEQNEQIAELEEIVRKYTCYVCKTHWNDLDDYGCQCGLRFCKSHDASWDFNHDGYRICIGCMPECSIVCSVCNDPYMKTCGENGICPSCDKKQLHTIKN